jgi:long-chain acyl-CoA synthetase
MLNGYGLTETGGNGALGSPLEWTTDAIGPMEVSLELKLVALPDLGYYTDRTPPQGEILLRGPPVLTAYYENPEETAAAVTPDGWFRTGDIGEFDANGHVKVIDRVKNLIKMQGGEYIALEKLEAVYRGCPYVLNLVVHGDSEHPRPIAVIIPNEKALADKAAELGVDEHVMCQDRKVRDVVLKALGAAARVAGLSSIETVAGIVLLHDQEWTPANVSTSVCYGSD